MGVVRLQCTAAIGSAFRSPDVGRLIRTLTSMSLVRRAGKPLLAIPMLRHPWKVVICSWPNWKPPDASSLVGAARQEHRAARRRVPKAKIPKPPIIITSEHGAGKTAF